MLSTHTIVLQANVVPMISNSVNTTLALNLTPHSLTAIV